MEVLISYGVDLLQGYYLQRPKYEPEELEQSKKETIIQCSKKQVINAWEYSDAKRGNYNGGNK